MKKLTVAFQNFANANKKKRGMHRIFPCGMKVQREGGGRILLGDNTCCRMITLKPISFQ
jgi:hypothetical protein